ncbi:hypothetical protein B4065_1608 [Caldibacillus thermoamylovorans]|jgi:hypothetical protein|nr:hypothetical protein B4065_1608 [Caldibacillus thermoamylovorans]
MKKIFCDLFFERKEIAKIINENSSKIIPAPIFIGHIPPWT